MRRMTLLAASLVLTGTFAMTYVFADDAKPAANPMDDQAAMDAWQKSMTPGKQHEMLSEMAGDFKADVTMKMSPDAPEEKATGKSSNSMIFGGRYLKCDYNGEMMGQPFKGLQMLGYDNLTNKYQTVWMDEMSTAMLFAQGDASDKTITMNTEMLDPMTNKMMKVKLVTIVKDHDHHTFEMYADGNKCMTIDYTRVK